MKTFLSGWVSLVGVVTSGLVLDPTFFFFLSKKERKNVWLFRLQFSKFNSGSFALSRRITLVSELEP